MGVTKNYDGYEIKVEVAKSFNEDKIPNYNLSKFGKVAGKLVYIKKYNMYFFESENEEIWTQRDLAEIIRIMNPKNFGLKMKASKK